MRWAIVADIHANLAAFQAVLADAASQQADGKLWCLGDIVGYGPEPHECIDLLRSIEHLAVAGNHDQAATGKVGTAEFNADAAAAARWTAGQLSVADRAYLDSLPLRIEEGDFTLVHGSPRDPVWEYILTTREADENFAHFATPYCLVGHSHAPVVFESGQPARHLSDGGLELGKARLIINVGGVGQPRDGDPRACYAVYDSDARTVTLRRVPYDIDSTQRKMVAAGLPSRLATRLSYGM